MCGCRLSWTRGTSYPKWCELAEGQWQLGPLPLPGLWGTTPEVLSTSQCGDIPQSRDVSGRPTCQPQRLEENENCHWGYLASYGKTSEQKNYWLNSTVTMFSNWMREAALCNIRAPDMAWEHSSSATWLFWASVSVSRKWGQHYLHYFLSLSLWRSK